jgi:mannonate dehydratase
VSSPLPHFVETFHDDGYMDMYKVMKALSEFRYSGSLMPDYIPQLVNDTGHRAGLAYCIV